MFDVGRDFRIGAWCGLVLFAGLLVAVVGCSYSQGDRVTEDDSPPAIGSGAASMYRSDIKTVAVPIFQNRDFQRDAEFMLTRALVQEIEVKSPYKVVPESRADTVLEGEIVSIRTSRLSDDRVAAVPQEQLTIYTIHFRWKDLRNGKILVERRGFEQASAYYPTLGEGRFVGLQQASEAMAGAIVQEMQADW